MTVIRYICPHCDGCEMDVDDGLDLAVTARHGSLILDGNMTLTASFEVSTPTCKHLARLLDELKRRQAAMLKALIDEVTDA